MVRWHQTGPFYTTHLPYLWLARNPEEERNQSQSSREELFQTTPDHIPVTKIEFDRFLEVELL